MTDAEQLCAWLQEAAVRWAQAHGGYPDVVAVVAGHVVVAGTDPDGAPVLTVHLPAKVAQWVKTANHFFAMKIKAMDFPTFLDYTEPES